MNRSSRPKLSLSSTLVRTLTSDQLAAAAGGCGEDYQPKARQTLNTNCNSGRCAQK